MILDALYAGTDRRTPSERIARNLLEEAFSSTRGDRNSALFITTFSSHIARLKSIVDFGKKTGRQILFLGRSLNKYTNAAIKVGKCPFQKNIKLVKYRKQINSLLGKRLLSVSTTPISVPIRILSSCDILHASII